MKAIELAQKLQNEGFAELEYKEEMEHELPTVSITDDVWVEIINDNEFGVNIIESREDDEKIDVECSEYRIDNFDELVEFLKAKVDFDA